MEAFGMADVLVEILDKQAVLAGRQQRGSDVAREQHFGDLVVKMEIA